MSDSDKLKRSEVVKFPQKRRGALRSIAIGVASTLGISGTASATDTQKVNPEDTVQESLSVDVESARNALSEASTSRLFEQLAEDGLISEQSIEAIPFDEMVDDSQLGEIEHLLVNGKFEQYNYHISVDGARLEIMLPLSDMVPAAFFHQKDAPEIVYSPSNDYRGGELQAESSTASIDSEVSTEANPCDPPLFRGCTGCVACCGLTNWSRGEAKQPCPNCWLTKCHWVKSYCC
ncbi:hypothetical protein ACTGNR_16575 (plasmid) [Halococcus salifodinae]